MEQNEARLQQLEVLCKGLRLTEHIRILFFMLGLLMKHVPSEEWAYVLATAVEYRKNMRKAAVIK